MALSQAAGHHFDKARRMTAAMDEPIDRVTALAGVRYTNPTFSRFPEEPGLALLLAGAGREAEAKEALAEGLAGRR